MRVRRFVSFILAAALAACLVGCEESLKRPRGFGALGELNRPDCRVGVLPRSLAEGCAREFFPSARIVRYDTLEMAVTALLAGRLEGLAADEHALRRVMRKHPDRLNVLEEPLDNESRVLVFASNRSNLCARANAFIGKLRTNGYYDTMLARWCFDTAVPSLPTLILPANAAQTIVFGTSCLREPLSYLLADGTPTGFDVEFARRFAESERCACEILVMPRESLLKSVQSGKIDCVIDGLCGDDVPEGLPFAPNYLDADVRVAVLRVDDAANDRAFSDFVAGLRTGCAETFVRDAQWKLVLSGLWVTIWMTLLSAFFGLLLAMPICAMRLSRILPLRFFAGAYMTVLQGTPVLIVLLFLAYVVFSALGASGTCVAVVTLTLWFSAQSAEILRTGISTVPRGQCEAARVLGFSSWKAFFEIVLPQAICVMSPVLGTACVNLLHKSSVVGYIAVVDLTMAIDLICGRSSTAFVPLLSTGAVYFLLAWLMVRGFDLLQRALMPKGEQ